MCKVCTVNRQKTDGGEVFITSSKKLEKVGIDLLTITHGKYLIVLIDYYTRYMKTAIINYKDTNTVA
jgi:hypothetical protein